MTFWFDLDWGGAILQIVEIRRPQSGTPDILNREMLERTRVTGN